MRTYIVQFTETLRLGGELKAVRGEGAALLDLVWSGGVGPPEEISSILIGPGIISLEIFS